MPVHVSQGLMPSPDACLLLPLRPEARRRCPSPPSPPAAERSRRLRARPGAHVWGAGHGPAPVAPCPNKGRRGRAETQGPRGDVRGSAGARSVRRG